MSHDIDYRNEKGEYFKLDEVMEEGGTYAIGNTDTTLNITYNYSWYYYLFLDKKEGIKWLYGKKGKDCVERLEKAIKSFQGFEGCKDYWCNHPTNCVKPLKILLKWCKEFPEGIFDGD